jgi:LmbE family N-acetylglucosaminyl deacetylase
MLQADTVISFSPSGLAEEDNDHEATGRALDEACALAASESDFQEHLEAGFHPQSVVERYSFHTHPDQPFNRVVDIGPYVERKIDAIVECRSQGGGGSGAELRARLAKQGKRLPLLGTDDRTANREYVRQFLLEEHRDFGRQHNLEYAERFYYVDYREPAKTKVDEYVEKNAVSI